MADEELYCGKQKCITPIVTLTNKKNKDTTKPHVFISGGVHGNEQVGQNVCIEIIKLFLE